MSPAISLQLRLPLPLARPARDADAKFRMPSWASTPSCNAALHVTKNGETLSTLRLDSHKYFVLGRSPDTCAEGRGFTISNPTLSRQHAALVHGDNDCLYAVDLDSPNGTWVNQQRLRPYEPMLLENANILRLGESSRRYVVRLCPRAEHEHAHQQAQLEADGDVRMDSEDEEDEEEENRECAASAPSLLKKLAQLRETGAGSPSAAQEALRRKHSLRQARIHCSLNAGVCFPSPKSLIARVPPHLRGADMAAAVAATASPCLSPLVARWAAADAAKDPSTLLPPPCLQPARGTAKVRARSLSTSSPPLQSAQACSPPSGGLLLDAAEKRLRPALSLPLPAPALAPPPLPQSPFNRARANSTSAAMKRPAPQPLYPDTVQRRRSVVEGCAGGVLLAQRGLQQQQQQQQTRRERRVSFSVAGPEVIGCSVSHEPSTSAGPCDSLRRGTPPPPGDADWLHGTRCDTEALVDALGAGSGGSGGLFKPLLRNMHLANRPSAPYCAQNASRREDNGAWAAKTPRAGGALFAPGALSPGRGGSSSSSSAASARRWAAPLH